MQRFYCIAMTHKILTSAVDIAAYLYRFNMVEKLKTELKAIQCSVDQPRQEESKGHYKPHTIDSVRKLVQKMKTS